MHTTTTLPYRRKAVLWLLSWLFAIAAHAQVDLATFTIDNFKLNQFDMSAKSGAIAKKDGNGRFYAIVKVHAVNGDDLRLYRFKFGLLESSDVNRAYDGERWLYVEYGAKKISIERQGYRTITQDLHLTIAEGQVYDLWISSEAAPVYMQMVQFNVSPPQARATILFGSEKFGDTDDNGQVAKSWPLGTYEYTVTAENYHPSKGHLTLDRPNQTYVEQVELRANFGHVTVNVDADADIYIDGELRGRRTWSGTLRAGTHPVECRMEKHKPTRQAITIMENEKRTLNMAAPTPINGMLSVTSKPLGATVIVDGKERGKTPLMLPELLIGQYKVELRMKNYRTEERTIEVEDRQNTELHVDMVDWALITIDSKPSGAKLSIDGKPVGQTPYKVEMSSGDLLLRLTHPNFQTYEHKHYVSSSQPNVMVRMHREFFKPSSFYAGLFANAGTIMGGGAMVGTYISNINLEASLTAGFAGATVFWNNKDNSFFEREPVDVTYRPMQASLKAGYGIRAAGRMRITPQAGVFWVRVAESRSACWATGAVAAVKAELGLGGGFNLFATPEVSMALKKSELFEQLSGFENSIKQWGSGFNAHIGLSYLF